MMLIKFYIRVLFNYNVYCFKNKTQKANFCKTVCFMRTDLWPLLSRKGRIPLDTRRRGSSCPILASTRLPLGLTRLRHLQSVFALKAFVSPLEKPPPRWSSHLIVPSLRSTFLPWLLLRMPHYNGETLWSSLSVGSQCSRMRLLRQWPSFRSPSWGWPLLFQLQIKL